MRFITTGSPYCIFQDGTILRVTRRGSVGTKGTLLEEIPGLIITLSDGSKLKSIFDIPDGREFTYSIAEQAKPAVKKPQRKANGKPKPSSPAAAPVKPAVAEAKPEAVKPVESFIIHNPDFLTVTGKKERTEAPQAKPAPVKPASVVQASPVIESDAPEIPEETGSKGDASPLRKMIKAGFMTLSLDNKLPKTECKNLTTQEYCQATFGVKAPVFREIFTKDNLQEQRLINGKVRYWKEVF
jgi:hypothetical protein